MGRTNPSYNLIYINIHAESVYSMPTDVFDYIVLFLISVVIYFSVSNLFYYSYLFIEDSSNGFGYDWIRLLLLMFGYGYLFSCHHVINIVND